MASFKAGDIWSVSGYIWSVLTLVSLYAGWEQYTRRREQCFNIVIFVTLCFAVRAAWFMMHFLGDQEIYMVLLNRFAFCLQLTAIACLVQLWGTALLTVDGALALRKGVKFGLAGLYIVVIGITGALASVAGAGDVYYSFNLFLMSVGSVLAMSVLFSFTVDMRIKLIVQGDEDRRKVADRLLHVTFIIGALFFARAIAFSFHPLSHRWVADDWQHLYAYPMLFYQLPESIVNLVILITISPRTSRFRKLSLAPSNSRPTEVASMGQDSESGVDDDDEEGYSAPEFDTVPFDLSFSGAGSRSFASSVLRPTSIEDDQIADLSQMY